MSPLISRATQSFASKDPCWCLFNLKETDRSIAFSRAQDARSNSADRETEAINLTTEGTLQDLGNNWEGNQPFIRVLRQSFQSILEAP